MAITNAERQAFFRARRKAEMRQLLDAVDVLAKAEQQIKALRTRVKNLTAENRSLKGAPLKAHRAG